MYYGWAVHLEVETNLLRWVAKLEYFENTTPNYERYYAYSLLPILYNATLL